MPKNLVIVESPAKAKTIEGYLGKDFVVKSSYGHVRDLPKSDKAIDVENGFKPTYEISDDKKNVVSDLFRTAKQSDTVWLATDDDREGEAISWHLYEALGLQNKDTKRIVFREITKKAILNAIENPRTIDIDLVNAQQARRILDRLVGFEISPVLWKIKTGLSAGRVQSVAVRMIVEREREILAFESKSNFRIQASFDLEKGRKLFADLNDKPEQETDAQSFLEKCVGAEFSIAKLETKPAKKSPAAPFTTSTLQQEAARKLGYGVARTMSLAQRLYESGKITYMRTDSTNLSEDAVAQASQSIRQSYGNDYVQNRSYKTKTEGAQEAHEAIRPTDFGVSSAGGDRDEVRLYELIWKRAIASQMADAQLERTVATIDIDPIRYNQANNTSEKMPNLIARGEVIKFDGFLKVYLESSDDDDNDEDEATKGMLPPLTVGQRLDLDQLKATERFQRHPPRYNEASLVKKLEEMGIGRPSTYAPIISTIQKRGYVVKEDREGKQRQYRELILKAEKIEAFDRTENYGAEKAKLFPTSIALTVNDFLVERFTEIMDYSFTAAVEKEFDEIAEGRKEWVKMLDAFYKEFHPKVLASKDVDRKELFKPRTIGIHPDKNEPILVIDGRYGPFVQIGETTDQNPKPQRASLRSGMNPEAITVEDALELFKLPRMVGTFEGKEMVAAVGRFGPYIRHDDKFVSLPKDEDPLFVTEETAIALIIAKRKADAEKFIKTFDENPEVQVLNGRYGPYIKMGKVNAKIPKDKEAAELTLEECLALVEESKNKPKRSSSSARKGKK
ncbi:type I DNA topoisomerase [Eisenibacter elegans]|uniref:type I DNA topoisomerase n=1 Tax=Eisenibacter elegans TaxID=997 RepID=UPI00041F51AA|nr:type I DNA topoisomerase [Eisenibacter elegans]